MICVALVFLRLTCCTSIVVRQICLHATHIKQIDDGINTVSYVIIDLQAEFKLMLHVCTNAKLIAGSCTERTLQWRNHSGPNKACQFPNHSVGFV